MIHHIEDEKINEELVKNSHKLVLIDFYADWCMPCQMLTPILSELDKKYNNLEVYKVNVDESQSTNILYNITSIPTMLFFKDGEEVERKVGLESLDNLSKIVEEFN
ncbi:MAG: thioredoxin [Bacilli bacterium]|nr:thioredoxin [Bacilli bacterium]